MGNTDEGRCTIDVEKIITQQIAAGILEKIPLEEKHYCCAQLNRG